MIVQRSLLVTLALSSALCAQPPATQDQKPTKQGQKGSSFDASAWNVTPGLGSGAGGKFGRRSPARQRKAQADEATAAAIKKALDWLKSQQDSASGLWRLEDQPDESRVIGVTALATLAFLGDGSTLRSGAYKSEVRRSMVHFRSLQDTTGRLDKQHEVADIDQVLGAAALSEAYGLSKYKILKKNAKLATESAVRSSPKGSWKFTADAKLDDAFATAWGAMLIMSADAFRLDKNSADAHTARMLAFLDGATDRDTGLAKREIAWQWNGRTLERTPANHGLAATAAIALSRWSLGQDVAEFRKAIDAVVAQPPLEFAIDDPEYLFVAATLVRTCAPDKWKPWSRCLGSVVKAQNGDGSWDPPASREKSLGKVQMTALCTLALQSHYRLIPKHDENAGK